MGYEFYILNKLKTKTYKVLSSMQNNIVNCIDDWRFFLDTQVSYKKPGQ